MRSTIGAISCAPLPAALLLWFGTMTKPRSTRMCSSMCNQESTNPHPNPRASRSIIPKGPSTWMPGKVLSGRYVNSRGRKAVDRNRKEDRWSQRRFRDQAGFTSLSFPIPRRRTRSLKETQPGRIHERRGFGATRRRVRERGLDHEMARIGLRNGILHDDGLRVQLPHHSRFI